MTVIVYRDGVMAADTGTFMGTLIVGETAEKIVRLRDGSLVACAGRVSDIQRFLAWARAGFDDRDRPEGFKDFGALLVTKAGAIIKYGDDCYAYPSAGSWGIEGCEPDFLTGLLVMGATAEVAVQHAIERCAYAAGQVMAVTL